MSHAACIPHHLTAARLLRTCAPSQACSPATAIRHPLPGHATWVCVLSPRPAPALSCLQLVGLHTPHLKLKTAAISLDGLLDYNTSDK